MNSTVCFSLGSGSSREVVFRQGGAVHPGQRWCCSAVIQSVQTGLLYGTSGPSHGLHRLLHRTPQVSREPHWPAHARGIPEWERAHHLWYADSLFDIVKNTLMLLAIMDTK